MHVHTTHMHTTHTHITQTHTNTCATHIYTSTHIPTNMHKYICMHTLHTYTCTQTYHIHTHHICHMHTCVYHTWTYTCVHVNILFFFNGSPSVLVKCLFFDKYHDQKQLQAGRVHFLLQCAIHYPGESGQELRQQPGGRS